MLFVQYFPYSVIHAQIIPGNLFINSLGLGPLMPKIMVLEEIYTQHLVTIKVFSTSKP